MEVYIKTAERKRNFCQCIIFADGTALFCTGPVLNTLPKTFFLEVNYY